MFRSVLLILFLAVLALPALATPSVSPSSDTQVASDCHGMPVKPQTEDTQHKDIGMKLHGCIGCIAPQSHDLALTAIEPMPFIVRTVAAKKLSGTVPPPSLPPPRA